MAAPVVVEAEARERGSALGQWNSAVTSYYLIAGVVALLVALGLVMVLSSSSISSLEDTKGASPYVIFLSQAKFALIGLPLAWLASRLPVAFYKRFAWPAVIGAGGLQVLVLLVGKEVYGNRNWLPLPGGQQIQPSEFVKLALAVWLGVVLARKQALLHQWAHVLVPGVVVAGAAVGLVLLGKDLGTGLIILMLVAGALFVAGVPLRFFAIALVFVGFVVWLLTIFSDSRMRRITAFLSAECDPQGDCYQTLRGTYGLATGGLTGIGLGESREKWSYLPAAHNDFILAIIGEELGLLGTLLVVALFGVLAVALTRVARRHGDPFVQITTSAIGAWVLGQAVINIAVVAGLFPVIGVPLPLVSGGGSALVTTMTAMGVLLSFARSEPGAAEALAARPNVVRRSLAVVGLATRPRQARRG